MGEGFILAHVSRVPYIMVNKTEHRELVIAGSTGSPIKKQRDECWCSPEAVCFIQSGTLAQAVVFLVFSGSPFSGKTYIHKHRDAFQQWS